ncbi:MAG: A/G-specific adenine glycosylase [Planctomycetota bacterium]
MPRAAFAARLLRWYDAGRRDLPWRRTGDPWAIWVSEVMLQQTRVEAVRDSWERFVARYPTPAAFARIGDDELMNAWRGLGYYRRARLLRDGARVVADRHQDRLPDDPEALGALPGVGAYTRGAIASIAFGRPEPAIDGNVERVVARHRALREPVAGAAVRRAIEATVRGWLDRRRPGDFNQALMELGATVCTPRAPRCAQCPVAADCDGRRQGLQAALPVARPRPAPIDVDARALVVAAGGRVLAFRVPDDEPNRGQWELPGPGILRSVDPADLEAVVAARCGARLAVGAAIATVRHAITRHRITLTAHTAALRGRARGALVPKLPHDPEVPWTTPARKVFARIAGAADARP